MERRKIYDGIDPNLTTLERVAEIRRRERAYDAAHPRPVPVAVNTGTSKGLIETYKELLAISRANKAMYEQYGWKMGWFTRFSFWIEPFLLLLFTPLAWLCEKSDQWERESIPYSVTRDIRLSDYRNFSEWLAATRQREDEYLAAKRQERREWLEERKARRAAAFDTFATLFFFSRLFK